MWKKIEPVLFSLTAYKKDNTYIHFIKCQLQLQQIAL